MQSRVVGKIDDFKRAMANVESRTASMEKKIAGEMAKDPAVVASRRADDGEGVRAGDRRDRRQAAVACAAFGADARSSMIGGAAGVVGFDRRRVGRSSALVGGFAAGASDPRSCMRSRSSGRRRCKAEAQRAGLVVCSDFQRTEVCRVRTSEKISARRADGWLQRDCNIRANEFILTGKGSGAGPIPSVHGVVRWRLIDLIAWLWEEFRITISKQTLSRELRAMEYRKLSARPRHHAKDEAAVAAFKKTSPPAWTRSRRRRLAASR